MRLGLLWLFVSFAALAGNTGINQQLPDGKWAYYGATFSTGLRTDYKATLFNILSSRHVSRAGQPDSFGACSGNNDSCYQHTAVGYNNARTIMFGELFLQRDAGGNFVRDVYCDNKIYYKQVSDISRMDNVVNIEHTWPQSKFSTVFNKDMQKSDLHHLFPADSKANGVRGNYEFGEVKSREVEADVPNCALSQIIEVDHGRVFTPPVPHRGNVARALFYFSVRYKMQIGPEQEAVLRRWHEEDPVDAEEQARMAKIAARQYDRNPFVDYPELVDQIADF